MKYYELKESKQEKDGSNFTEFQSSEPILSTEPEQLNKLTRTNLSRQELFFKAVTNTKRRGVFNVIGVSRCGCHSVVRWLSDLGHTVNFQDGDSFTIKPDAPNPDLGEVIVVLRNPIDHRKSHMRMYGHPPTKTPQQRIPYLTSLHPIFFPHFKQIKP